MGAGGSITASQQMQREVFEDQSQSTYGALGVLGRGLAAMVRVSEGTESPKSFTATYQNLYFLPADKPVIVQIEERPSQAVTRMLTSVERSPLSLKSLYLMILLPPLSGLKSNRRVIVQLVDERYLGIGGCKGTVAAVNSLISDQGPAPTALIARYLNE